MQELYLLGALDKLDALGVEHLRRFLFDTGLTPAFELLAPLLSLEERGLVALGLREQGVVYEITEAGRDAYAREAEAAPEADARIAAMAAEYSGAMQMEKQFLAQYSEQSSGIVPVFLSIREGSKIVMKVSVIVHDVGTAKKIADLWAKSAPGTYQAVWEQIAPGEPMPAYWSQRPR